MSSMTKALAVIAISTAGLWGCAQGPIGATAQERVKALEARNARLEEDYKSVAAVRDQLRKQIAEAEAEKGRLGRQLVKLTELEKDRSELKVQLAQRTTERDSVSAQFDQFRQNLRELVGRSEAAAKSPDKTRASGPALVPGRS
jgi:chromosome segregation ATPase